MSQSTPQRNLVIFLTFLRLGCIAFGGPAAHLVLFFQYFVKQEKWITEHEYAHLLALAQVLPGPTSSQLGMAIGFQLNRYQGACFAWLGFTLPSALLMCAAATLSIKLSNQLSTLFFHVIQLIVLAVVAWAFWQMMRSFCKTKFQYLVMLLAAFFIYFFHFSLNQVLVILCAAIIGLVLSSNQLHSQKPNIAETVPPKHDNFSQNAHENTHTSWLWLLAFISPFFVLPFFDIQHSNILAFSLESFYRTASLVFGGGHIILPFLHQDFVSTGLISNENFDLGYALAQLMPGPLFSFAAYLGTLLPMTDAPILNAALATVAIFLPSFLLLFGLLPFWNKLMKYPMLFGTLKIINAAVVGLLLCLLFQMSQKYIIQWTDCIFVAVIIALLRSKLPVWFSLISSFIGYYAFLSFLPF